MIRRMLKLAWLALAFAVAGNAQGVNWPSFRGPDASGIAEGYSTPVRWDVASGENIRWQTPIPGLGHSSPVVWGDRLFVATAVSGKAEDELRVALDPGHRRLPTRRGDRHGGRSSRSSPSVRHTTATPRSRNSGRIADLPVPVHAG